MTDEKVKIAENYLIPKALDETGLQKYQTDSNITI